MRDRVPEVGEIRSGGAPASAHQGGGSGWRQLAGKLPVLPVGEIDQRLDRAAILQVDRPNLFPVDAVVVDLALAQIAADRVVAVARQPVGEPATGAAGQQPQDQAGLLRCAAIVFGLDAEGAMPAMKSGRLCLGGGEARVPHQRAVAEDPGGLGRAHAWLRWISARRISRVRVNSSDSLSPSPQRMARCR